MCRKVDGKDPARLSRVPRQSTLEVARNRAKLNISSHYLMNNILFDEEII
jgi:hypothetical protein